MSSTNITAAILVGGLGTRLQPVLPDKPKVLAEVKGRPFLSYILDQLVDAGVTRVVLCSGYKADQVQEVYGAWYQSLALVYSQESVPLGTGGALRLAYPLLESEQVLVMNGDSYCQVDVSAFEKWHSEKKTSVSMIVTSVSDVSRFGRIRMTSHDQRIVAFEEKTPEIASGLINAGIYFIAKSSIFEMPEHEMLSLERTMFPQWIATGIYGFETRGKFLDIGTPESFSSAAEYF